uniref:enkurin-like n=1 Tax=Styela clava TaxID=7725 RepID=UPI00193A1193|nr:enkurin-like [Styela clava]
MDGGMESIYNLIPMKIEKPPKPPRYESKFRTAVKDETKQNRSPNKTMGPAKVDVPTPGEFLKKRSGEPQLPDRKDLFFDDKVGRKPPVPRKDDKPLMGIRTNKNFINTNAVENIMSVPKKPVPKYVDTRWGDNGLLEHSGLVPKYTKKNDYGTVPEYLKKRNEETRRAQEEYDHYIRERMRQGAMKQLTDEERDGIIGGLKKNWEELHHQYQGLSVVTDTAPKKNRKERMEAEMKQLERDIELIERHKIIYIAN